MVSTSTPDSSKIDTTLEDGDAASLLVARQAGERRWGVGVGCRGLTYAKLWLCALQLKLAELVDDFNDLRYMECVLFGTTEGRVRRVSLKLVRSFSVTRHTYVEIQFCFIVFLESTYICSRVISTMIG